MIKKNDEYTDIVTGISSDGNGVVLHDGIVVFLPFSLVDEKVRYKIVKVTKNYCFGKVLEVLTPAENRVREKCSVFYKCGGCQLQHMKYSSQLKVKENNVYQCFNRIAGLNVEVKSCVKSVFEYGYRNKLQLPVSVIDGRTVIGFFAENSHRVIPIKDCPINPSWTATVISVFSQYFNEYNIKGYDEELNSGDVREITVKDVNGNLIITLVVLDKNISGIDYLIGLLKSNLHCEFSLFLNVNKKETNVIYGEEFILKYGKPEYFSEDFGIKNPIGVRSFSQVNKEVCLKLYSAVKDELPDIEDLTVIDAYSGAGLMTALLSQKAKRTFGIEIVKEAVNCANNLAKINGLDDKITNYCAKVEDVLPNILKDVDCKKTCIVLDPPRKGCDYSVIKAILDSGINKIIYVSCKPSTLARDVGLLVGNLEYLDGAIKKAENPVSKYKVVSVRPFDMFPQTKHVETVCLLTKK